MNKITTIWATILSIFILTQSAVVAAENIKYTGTIYATSVQSLMPLGNGDGVVIAEVVGVSAMSGNPPSLFGLACAGMGIEDEEGRGDIDIYCTFKENENDSFDLKGTVKQGAAKLKVIGGSGKFAGATGKGTYKRTAGGKPGSASSTKGIIEVSIKTK